MNLKPKLSPDKLIEKMQSKGITFNNISEQDAIEYLKNHNNYYRLASYRKNYDKHTSGENKGKYIDLDFSYLIDLSTIDMRLRFILMNMCLDIEHTLKVHVLEEICANEEEDGYQIVADFLSENSYILQEICKKRFSTYVGELINKHFTFETITSEDGIETTIITNHNCPIWAFMEIIGFGDFIKFYKFYYSSLQNAPVPEGALNLVKSLRNACAHNNCLIHNLRSGCSRPPHSISCFVSQITSISKDIRTKNLRQRPILEMTALLYVYNLVVVDIVKFHRFNELDALLSERMLRNKHYYKNQQIISSTYCYFRKIVDFLI